MEKLRGSKPLSAGRSRLIGIWHIGVCEYKSFELIEIASSDSPILREPSILIGTSGIRSQEVENLAFGFSLCKEIATSEIVILRFPIRVERGGDVARD
jgi:hypothetical protein